MVYSKSLFRSMVRYKDASKGQSSLLNTIFFRHPVHLGKQLLSEIIPLGNVFVSTNVEGCMVVVVCSP